MRVALAFVLGACLIASPVLRDLARAQMPMPAANFVSGAAASSGNQITVTGHGHNNATASTLSVTLSSAVANDVVILGCASPSNVLMELHQAPT
jgi:hypothetical protein